MFKERVHDYRCRRIEVLIFHSTLPRTLLNSLEQVIISTLLKKNVSMEAQRKFIPFPNFTLTFLLNRPPVFFNADTKTFLRVLPVRPAYIRG